MATPRQWIAGARPRTLPAAIAPVAIGTGAAAGLGSFRPWQALACLVIALALQVGVNYANDYSDGVRGTDDVRIGPARLVGGKQADPRQVKAAAWGCFAAAAVCGLALVWSIGAWWMLLVGAACIAAAWWYTGGSRPYGYQGLGEVFVFVFFGLVATLGTTFAQAGRLSTQAAFGAVAVGLLTCAILMANNIRDIPGDEQVDKLTLAVRLGDHGARVAFTIMVAMALVCTAVIVPLSPGALLALPAFVLAVHPIRIVRAGVTGAGLIPVLVGTGKLTLAHGLLLAIGLAWRG